MHLRMELRSVALFLAVLAALYTVWNIPSANAQFSSFAGNLKLSVSPQVPDPHESFTVSVDDYSVSSVGSDIFWYIDGEEASSYRNERTITLAAKGLGKATTVRASLVRNGVEQYRAVREVIPAKIDLILEADTYVPDFFRGRTLPSPESSIRAVALVHDGTNRPESAYTYKWSENGSVIFGGPLKGKYAVDHRMSRFRNMELSVEVYDAEGAFIGRDSVSLSAREPEIHFYEHSPLRGLLAREVRSPLPMIGEEVTVYGEPFFLDVASLRDATFSWSIDGARTASNENEGNAITLRRVGDAARAAIEMEALTSRRIPQRIENGFTLFFQ